MAKRRVIVVTDGDGVARQAVELAAKNVGGRCISLSAGNPTTLTGREIADLAKQAAYDPVIVMVDDRGKRGKGPGEKALEELAHQPDIEIIGAVAVASNTDRVRGIKMDCSIDNRGELIEQPVDKYGVREKNGHQYVEGDTVDILNKLDIPFIVGVGDVGKMDGKDDVELGAPITTRALMEILKRSDADQDLHKKTRL